MLDEKAAGRAGAGGTLREVILGGALFGVLEALTVTLTLTLTLTPTPTPTLTLTLTLTLFGVLEALPALPLALAHSP